MAPALLRAFAIGLIAGYALCAPEAHVEPVRVCEVLQNLSSYSGKVVAVVGRYSFRRTGRFISESICGHKTVTGGFTWPNVMRISFDEKNGPRPPERMEIDPRTVYQKLAQIEQHTALAKIRFGTPDYDRWAVVYGRIEPSPALSASPPPIQSGDGEFEPAPVHLICRSEVVVMFFKAEPDEQ